MLLVLDGSLGGASALGVAGAPSVVAVGNGLGEVTEATTEIRTQRLDEWRVSHLQRNQGD